MTHSELNQTLIQISKDQLRLTDAVDTNLQTQAAMIITIQQMTHILHTHETAIRMLITAASQPAIIGSN